ncbi:MAG: hypothetical protein HYY26_02850 [Acidobacteria bacterium]|nr:hypothetical protein [Acidobacteriota bacterium]
MKRTITLILALALTTAAGVALAGSQEGKATKVEGTLVDSKCYLMNEKNVSNDHMTPKGTMPNCGTACAKMGIPVSLLTTEGKVYTLAVPAPVIADHVGKTARASGTLKQASLIVDKLEVKEGTTWKEVPIATMM